MPDEGVNNKTKKPIIKHWVLIAGLLVLFDVISTNAAYFIVLWGRFDFNYSDVLNSSGYFYTWLRMIPLYAVVVIVVFALFRLYNSVWRFASVTELLRIAGATIVTGLIYGILATIMIRFCTGKSPDARMPYSYYIAGPILQGIFTFVSRFAYRMLLFLKQLRKAPEKAKIPVMIVGAGNAGCAILRDINTDKESDLKVACFIDDNSNKWNRYVEGVPVVGDRNKILENVEKYGVKKIYIAIPSAPNSARRDIVNICKESHCEVMTLPSTVQILRGDVSVSALRPVSITDILGREVITVNTEEVFNYLVGKRILVTGGGGSIGSELCRQIAAHNPRQLVIFDIYENNAYDIQQELKKSFPYLNLVTLIGSVRDSRRLEDVFSTYRPEIVFHAAAHKHVPLMEDSPEEAVKNNVIGTYKTAYAAVKYGTEKFVLISTDKAVNPTSIMGASKRLCEMVIQTMNTLIKAGKTREIPKIFTHYEEKYEELHQESDLPEQAVTDFAAVRFGNVLGSNGSVIPIFRRQIAEGGPVTVTHPDIIRYFMTIPEAVSLVLQASVYAHGGEIFVLDMGEPVKIDTLARNMIRLSGLTPDEDIKIVYTGLRPGEKLFEEKLMAEEGIQKTDNELIYIGKPFAFDCNVFLKELKKLLQIAYSDEEATRKKVMELVLAGRN